MPDGDNAPDSPVTEIDSGAPSTPGEESSAHPAPPPPPADPSPEVRELRAQLSGLQDSLAVMRDGFNALAANRLASNPTQEAPIAELSDDQIETALAEGKGATAVRHMINSAVEKARREIQRTAIDPLAQQVQVTGIGALSAHAFEIVRPQLEYYQRYQKEMDDALNTMAPELKMDPRNIRHLHDLVAGRHIKELLAEEREKVIRQLRENPSSLPGAAAGRQTAAKRGVPSAEELLGKEAAAAAAAKGGEDAFAQKLGYADWEDYAKKTGIVEGSA